MLQFQTVDDMQRIWQLGSINLNPGILRLIKWSPEFSPTTYKNTFAQIWVRFWDLGFAYWNHQTWFEIARGVVTPIKLDKRTANRTLGLYARVLIDVDLSKPLCDQIRVARKNGAAVIAKIEYESVPVLCQVCGIVGHSANKCRNKPEVSLNGEQSEQVLGGSTERVGTQNAEGGRSVVRRQNRSRRRSKKSKAPESQPLERPEVLGTKPVLQMVGNETIMTSSSRASDPPGFLGIHKQHLNIAQARKRQLWSDLNAIHAQHVRGPWVVFGDFNCVFGAHEKRGGSPPNATSCREFQQMCTSCDLIDIPTKGLAFTWTNRRVEEQLDRALGLGRARQGSAGGSAGARQGARQGLGRARQGLGRGLGKGRSAGGSTGG
ncbi:hypothetical protein ACLB2K_046746 [Fragaria x ananassa]